MNDVTEGQAMNELFRCRPCGRVVEAARATDPCPECKSFAWGSIVRPELVRQRVATTLTHVEASEHFLIGLHAFTVPGPNGDEPRYALALYDGVHAGKFKRQVAYTTISATRYAARSAQMHDIRPLQG